jgi:hypothetical protein
LYVPYTHSHCAPRAQEADEREAHVKDQVKEETADAKKSAEQRQKFAKEQADRELEHKKNAIDDTKDRVKDSTKASHTDATHIRAANDTPTRDVKVSV